MIKQRISAIDSGFGVGDESRRPPGSRGKASRYRANVLQALGDALRFCSLSTVLSCPPLTINLSSSSGPDAVTRCSPERPRLDYRIAVPRLGLQRRRFRGAPANLDDETPLRMLVSTNARASGLI